MLTKKISQTLSLRLSLIMACVIALLLLVSLAIMFYFSRQALKDNAMRNAGQMLETTVQNIDNVLLSVEQSAGNIYWEMLAHLNEPDHIETYCRQLVECNPYIVGSAIAFKPYYYPNRKLFMRYVHRKGQSATTNAASELVSQETFANRPYTEQVWYTETVTLGHACWTDPLKNKDTEGEALATFCLPIFDRQGQCVGVLAADIAIELLSQIVLAAKPSPHGYSTLLGGNGSYIIHPDKEKLTKQNVFSQFMKENDPSLRRVVKSMIDGESGQQHFLMNGGNWYVVYKPFTRSEVVGRTMEHLGWSVGVVYPENDIFGDYNLLLYLVVAIALVGLVLSIVFSRLFNHCQLAPLDLLTHTAQQISRGHFNISIPDTTREDEIGQLQDDFQQMQHSLATQIAELKRLNFQLKERSKELELANWKAHEADRMKTAFLHQMTYQMLEPADTLNNHVATLCNNYHTISLDDVRHEIEAIRQQGKTIVDLLGNMIHSANNETEQEDAHE